MNSRLIFKYKNVLYLRVTICLSPLIHHWYYTETRKRNLSHLHNWESLNTLQPLMHELKEEAKKHDYQDN